MKHNRNDLTGQTFGHLTVIEPAESRVYANGWKAAMWHCLCSCGAEKVARAMDLRRGSATSCGCFRREKARRDATVHGLTGSPKHKLWAAARDRHRRRGVPFDLKLGDIEIPERCPVLGIKLEPGTKRFQATSPSIDRLDPAKGYTADNITVMSFRANSLKGDATLEELQAVLRYMQEEPPEWAMVQAYKEPQKPDLRGNLVGERFGRLVVSEQHGRKCRCSCDCGVVMETYASQLQFKRSCGCGWRGIGSGPHGESSKGGRGTDRYELWRGAKQRAKAKGLLFDIAVQGISIPERCPVLGFPLEANIGGKSWGPSSPSLDRFDPAKGYVVGNVAVISQRANWSKGDGTVAEMRALTRWLQRKVQ